eukprot:6485712-Amphidinium_carterae.2
MTTAQFTTQRRAVLETEALRVLTSMRPHVAAPFHESISACHFLEVTVQSRDLALWWKELLRSEDVWFKGGWHQNDCHGFSNRRGEIDEGDW